MITSYYAEYTGDFRIMLTHSMTSMVLPWNLFTVDVPHLKRPNIKTLSKAGRADPPLMG